MPDKILFVDDDPSILDAYQRTLHKHLPIEIASGGAEALEKIRTSGPYSVVVTDIQMPVMDGIELLTRTSEIAPDTVRMVLTGNGGLKSVMDALEHGGIFRYLTKPVPPENMLASLEAGVKQYQLQVAERDLLEKTLQGSIRVMLEILSTVNPEVFGRAQALKGSMRRLAISLKQDQLWRFELGAMLAPLGMVTIPPSTLYKLRKGQPLGPVEEALLLRSPEISHNLISNIPRLEAVAKIVLYQKKNFDGTGFPENKVAGEDIPLGARMLRVLTDLTELESGSLSRAGAFVMLRKRAGWYDPKMIDAVANMEAGSPVAAPVVVTLPVAVKDLRMGQKLAGDVVSTDGAVLASAGTRLTAMALEKIRNAVELTGVQEPISIEREAR
ncbi:response regulator receiver modulated metal-depenent phosphohydrolase [Capsulimonas corticalis]|uniref:Response regulator receiver modulated metal-depenent phosphohydrolase n=1 Tax=Capsulimonas corticalis TaxID=2219043 RepID=A0A402D5A1_9BACT|nr:HD domain-containing phosphohydrolase [Capsulimonas corticalis]BDI29876.1 response regulator receiver modulated metal-depenent phosphohydrolase [Capsulimonas corticalis]